MRETKAVPIRTISSLDRGDVVRHVTSGQTFVIVATYDKFAIGITHQHISNPKEWELVVQGVRAKEQLEDKYDLPEGEYTLEIDSAEVHEMSSGSMRARLRCTVVAMETAANELPCLGKKVVYVVRLALSHRDARQGLIAACDLPAITEISQITDRLSQLPGRRFTATCRHHPPHYISFSNEQPPRYWRPQGPYR